MVKSDTGRVSVEREGSVTHGKGHALDFVFLNLSRLFGDA